MNAVEYFKKNGLSKSKTHLDKMDAEEWHNEFYRELKQIIDAFELVEFYGGLGCAKTVEYGNIIPNHIVDELSRSIQLVEQCT